MRGYLFFRDFLDSVSHVPTLFSLMIFWAVSFALAMVSGVVEEKSRRIMEDMDVVGCPRLRDLGRWKAVYIRVDRGLVSRYA